MKLRNLGSDSVQVIGVFFLSFNFQNFQLVWRPLSCATYYNYARSIMVSFKIIICAFWKTWQDFILRKSLIWRKYFIGIHCKKRFVPHKRFLHCTFACGIMFSTLESSVAKLFNNSLYGSLRSKDQFLLSSGCPVHSFGLYKHLWNH